MTHVLRSRQLPTNHNHAFWYLPTAGATREYQFDSPSINALLSGSEFSRDGPKMKNEVAGGWNFSPISIV